MMDYEIKRGAKFLALSEGQYVLKTRYSGRKIENSALLHYRIAYVCMYEVRILHVLFIVCNHCL